MPRLSHSLPFARLAGRRAAGGLHRRRAGPGRRTERRLGRAAATAEPVTITYFTFSAAPDHLEDLDQMIAAFEAANPGIKVKVETAPFADYFTKLQTLIAGGTAPDVFELNYENFVTYAGKDVLLDLTPLVEADTGFADRLLPARLRRRSAVTASSTACPRASPTSSCSTTRTCSTRPASTTPPPTGPGRMSWPPRRSSPTPSNGRLGRLQPDPVLGVLQDRRPERLQRPERRRQELDHQRAGAASRR